MNEANYLQLKVKRLILSFLQAVAAISDIRKDIPIHLELASMTDKDYMNSIMQEVHVENRFTFMS